MLYKSSIYEMVLAILLLSDLWFWTKKVVDKIDSTAYYIQLANFNKKTNNYKFALTFSQKAFNYAKAQNNVKGKARALFSLASTYFDLKKTKRRNRNVFSKCWFFQSAPSYFGLCLVLL